jgi:alpha-tubulin suppressor-like RCC1 family protein
VELRAGRWTTRSQRQGLVLIFMAMVAALSMALASAAQATPNTAKAWGNNGSGQLGDGTTEGPEKCNTEACSTVPVAVSGLSGVVAVSGGEADGLALLESGRVMAWGSDEGGQLGNGTEGSSNVPVPVCAVGTEGGCPSGPYLEEVTAISAGGGHSLALLEDGTVVAWGTISFGGLGNGTTEPSPVPVRVCAVGTESTCPSGPYLSEVTAIAAGRRFSLAVSGGTVVAWGQQGARLGDGSEGSEPVAVPVRVCAAGPQSPCPSGPYLTGATAVSASAENGLALLSSGKVMAWGENSGGQLGNGTEIKSDVPVEVSGLSGVSAIAAGGELTNGGGPHMLALLESGTVKAWGNNEDGQLGDGTSAGPETCGLPFAHGCSKTPVAVSGLSEVTAIAARGHHSLALLKNGEVRAWGENSSGELGAGTSVGPEPCGLSGACSTIPVAVCAGSSPGPCPTGPFLSGVSAVSAGSEHSLAFGPPPAVTKLVPRRGPVTGGTTVTITGTDLTGATEVKFGSTAASSFTVNSSTSITAVTPAELAGGVDVTVINTWGTSAISKVDRFKFLPTVTGLSPNTGSTAGGTSVTVTGAGFALGTTATKFKFGKTKATSVNCTSSTECSVVAPAHAAGTVDVRATVNKVTSAKTPADQFTYN